MPEHSLAPVRVNPVLVHPHERRTSLSGRWGFRLDPDERGLRERWHRDAVLFTEEIEVPGCWQGQGFGGDEKETVWDFRLQARTFRATYTGTGWYARVFHIPNGWEGLRVWLLFGGAYPSAQVWLDGVPMGEHHEPFVPFGFEITEHAEPGREHLLVVRVHEQDRIMGLAYNWQGNWSGLYRDVELVATGGHFLERLWLYPEVDAEQIRVVARIGGFPPEDDGAVLRLSVHPAEGGALLCETEIPVAEADVTHAHSLPSPRLWSPDKPYLYRVDAELVRGDEVLDARSERTGFVKLSTHGKHFLINGEPYYMRGTGEFLPFPETGSPDTNRERLRRKLGTLRAYGYNYVRCQSYAPVPEYYDVADEVGLLVQAEMGMLGAWGGMSQWHVYAWPRPTPQYRRQLKRQWDHVVMRDVNHPSANLYCMSNELRQTHFPRTAWRCYHDTKAIKPTALVIWTDGGYDPELPGDFVNAEAELDERCGKPLIQHEFRWWSSFPDVTIMRKYAGAVRPYAAEIALEAAARHGIGHVLAQGAKHSQRLQFIEAKGKMEACRRDHPMLAGICHFNAMDTNPSPQGIVDEFFERKYADAATWLQTNGDTVVLSSLGFDDRVLEGGQTFSCELFISDFSHPPFENPTIAWRLTAGETVLVEGRISHRHEPYRTCSVGRVEAAIGEVASPAKARIEVRLSDGGREAVNAWDLWLFPAEAPLPESVAIYGPPRHTWLAGCEDLRTLPQGTHIPDDARVILTEVLDEELLGFVRRGGCAILAASEGLLRPFDPKLGLVQGRYFFTPPANYPPYEDGHDGTIILDHPMLGDFPHEGFADLHFFRMMGEAPPLELEPLHLHEGDPIIRVLHSYPSCRPLGYLVERRVGDGRLIICALDLEQSLPEARYLLAQVCRYGERRSYADALPLGDAALCALREGLSLI